MIRIPTIDVAGRRVKRLSISPDQLVAWIQSMREPRTFSAKGLPDDAVVLACVYDADRRLIQLLIESESYPEREPGSSVEEFDVQFTVHTEAVALHR